MVELLKKRGKISRNKHGSESYCFFDTEDDDLWDYLWFVPAPDLIKLGNKLDGGKLLGFVAGRQKKESNK